MCCNTSNKQYNPSETFKGKFVSNTSISLENLAKILPSGVTSKNTNGARIIPLNISKCIATAAYQQPKRGMRSANTEPIAEIQNIS